MSRLAPTDLPIENSIIELRSALENERKAVLVAEPGAGKSTIVPLRLLDESWLGDQTILVLEPRRVAARAVAKRMAQLLETRVGDVVGYRVRDDAKVSAATRIVVVTEGILTRRLQTDPELVGVGAVIFDEFHERSVHADMGLAFALDTAETLREDLRILVMSATIDAQKIAHLLSDTKEPAPIVACEGRTYPVDIRWRPRKQKERLENAMMRAVEEALNEPGDVLAFMPGIAEIRRLVNSIQQKYPQVSALPLYGGLDSAAQDEALRANPAKRRVIVSTDVAETSLTVEGIGVVIDSGVARRPRFDPATGLTKLVTVDHSRASAQQRCGRAGRLGPGVAIRLWSKLEHGARKHHEPPEILQIDIASVLLEAAAWGTTINALQLLDQPDDKAIAQARDVLQMLDALDINGRITKRGRAMLTLPLPPRLAAMVAASGDGPLGWTACVLAALLSERDVIAGRPSERPADVWSRITLVEDLNVTIPFSDGRAIKTVRSRARDIAKRCKARRVTIAPEDVGRTLALAYPDRLAQNRGGRGGRFRLRSGIGAQVPQHDQLALEAMLVVAEVTGEKRNPQIRRAAPIDAIDVELGFQSEITERRFLGWDAKQNDVSQRVERRLGSLDFGTVDEQVQPSEEVTQLLLEQIQTQGLKLLSWSTQAKQLQARVVFAATHCPQEELPDVCDETLRRDAQHFFTPWLLESTSLKDVAALDMAQIFESELSWKQKQRLDTLAPSTYTLPSGRQKKIDYTKPFPLVSVRAQELFGVTQTPMLADGAVLLTFELLSPAQRPIQTTNDLAGFWNGSWHDVRKEMKGRYPKHDWPEKP